MIDLLSGQHIHFVGIGGSGMSALARLLLDRGYAVTGSDRTPGEATRALETMGAVIYIGHAAEQVEGADVVVMTAAARASNPEIEEAHNRGIPVIKRAALLGAIANAGDGIAVAGTHGKTTTSALVGHILLAAGLDPTVVIGGVSRPLGSNARVGRSNLVVVEADEYDRSFHHLRPKIAVITNVEPDHLEYFGSIEAVDEAFRQFARQVEDTLVVCADDSHLLQLVKDLPVRQVTYGLKRADWIATDVVDRGGMTRFVIRHLGAEVPCATQLAGAYNVQNALAAIVVSHLLGVELETAAASLQTFTGAARRTECKGEVREILVLDDYAVHPTEIRTTLEAIKARYKRPIRLAFQPHTYTRAKIFLPDFARSFSDADAVYLLDIYAARETDTLGISTEDLARAAEAHHPRVRYTGSHEATVQQLVHDAEPGDVIVTMGAGDVTRLGPAILSALERT